jgi:hypothetical protein
MTMRSLPMSSTRKRTNSLGRMPVEYGAIRMTRAWRLPAALMKRVTSSGLSAGELVFIEYQVNSASRGFPLS